MEWGAGGAGYGGGGAVCVRAVGGRGVGGGGDDDPFIVLTETKFSRGGDGGAWGACTRAHLDWEGPRCPSQQRTN